MSHTIRAGLTTYPGLPEPVITPHLTREQSVSHYAPGTTFAMDVITMIGNTGTYLDSPFHRYANGTDLAGLSLDTLVELPAETFHLADAAERGIPASVFYDRDVAGKAVLLHTGWDRHFGTPAYAEAAPFLSEAGAYYLVDQGVVLVGIDSLNIDDTKPEAGGARPAHTLLLGADVHVVEHLRGLHAIPPSGAFFTAVPPKIEGFGTFPVARLRPNPRGIAVTDVLSRPWGDFGPYYSARRLLRWVAWFGYSDLVTFFTPLYSRFAQTPQVPARAGAGR